MLLFLLLIRCAVFFISVMGGATVSLPVYEAVSTTIDTYMKLLFVRTGAGNSFFCLVPTDHGIYY